SSIVPATEAHLSFGHFQPRGVTACEQTEGRADDNSFGLRRRNDERLPGGLLLNRCLHGAALQPDTPSILVRLIHDDRITLEVELGTIPELHSGGAVRPDGNKLLTAVP